MILALTKFYGCSRLWVVSVREENMARRRQRILDEARRAISEEGYAALNLRSLAEAAGVTQPTLYNLIGNKEQIVFALLDEGLAAIEARLRQVTDTDPVAMLEAVAVESTALFRSDETSYRAALLAADVVEDQERVWGLRVGKFQRSLALARSAVQELEARGLLNGTIPVERIAEVMLGAYRSACHDWARRLISIDDFERRALIAVYLTAAADAKPELRTQLTARLAELDEPAPRIRRTAVAN